MAMFSLKSWCFHLKNLMTWEWENERKKEPQINFSSMSPKLTLTYPHRVENRRIAILPLFLRLILLKVLCPINQIFCRTWFFHKYSVCILWYCLLSNLLRQQLFTPKKSDILVLTGKNVNFISLLSVIKEVWYINQWNSCDKWDKRQLFFLVLIYFITLWVILLLKLSS